MQFAAGAMALLLLTWFGASQFASGAAFVPHAHLSSTSSSWLTQTSTSHSKSSSSKTPTNTALSMASAGSLNCRPVGIGSAAPHTILLNSDLESVVETSDDWIATRTGIRQRHVLLQDESIKDLGARAAKAALEMAGIDPAEIDLVICATSSADDMFGDATSIAAECKCTKAMGFDLTAACSGFLFATVTAGQFLSSPNTPMQHALVIGADALSRWVDWDDRNSCILFGDGAGAMVLTRTSAASSSSDDASDVSSPGLLGYAAHSNGLGYCDLNLGYKGEARHISTPGEGTTLSSGSYSKLAMKGKEVYKFATREVPTVLQEALTAAGMTVDDVDWLLLHQANIRIMEVVADRLGVPKEKIITNLACYGNTSAASIPLALDEAVRTGKVKKGDVIACAGFGAGLSWGAAILRWG